MSDTPTPSGTTNEEPLPGSTPTAKPTSKSTIRGTIISLAFGALSLYAIYQFLEDKSSLSRILEAPAWLIAACIGMFALIYLIDAFRTKMLVSRLGEKIGWGPAIVNGIYGYYYSYVTPSAVGGQPFQIYHLYHNGIQFSHATNILLTRMLEFFVLSVIFAVTGYILYSGFFIGLGITGQLFLVGFIISIIIIIIFFLITVSDPVKRLILKSMHWKIVQKALGIAHHTTEEIEEKINKTVIQLRESLKTLWVDHIGLMILDTILGLLVVMIQSTILWLAIASFSAPGGKPPTIWDTFFIHQLLTLVVFYVPTPGGSGAIEVSYHHVLSSPLLTNQPGAVFLGIGLWRITTFYFPIFLGFTLSLFEIWRTRKKQA